MTKDAQRIARLQEGVKVADLDALLCTLPSNVLLLSGYWPVVGSSIAVVARDGRVAVVAPEDERENVGRGWADQVRTFKAGSLKELKTPVESACGELAEAIRELGLTGKMRIGFEHRSAHQPAPYVGMQIYGPATAELIREAAPQAEWKPAGELIERLREVLTPSELTRLRLACRFAEHAYKEGARGLQSGVTELAAARLFRQHLDPDDAHRHGVHRAGGSVWCMSGPNSAQAYKAFAHSSARELKRGDLVLMHCNSQADGFFTDITRTYSLGQPGPREQEWYEAVFEASRAAFATIKPGVKAAAVDAVAREIMKSRGFSEQFKHSTGHGVGFAAIDHLARPRLHPVSPDILETGMVFNVEPAAYFEGLGGVRQCNMVVVTGDGAQVLTEFQNCLAEVTLP